MFYSIGVCLFTGKKTYTVFPLNLLLYPLLKMFRLDIPLYSFEEAAASHP